jgi:putative pyruvate formate lyase activating enzyme
MPDFKFWNVDSAKQFAAAPDYPQHARKALKEMYRQVGNLELDSNGIAVSGLLVRHLVMPGSLDETEEIMHFLSSISKNIYVNVMEQYRPCYKAFNYPQINNSLSRQEYKEALTAARNAGLKRLEQGGLLRILEKLDIFPDM